jgi:hypothetical protein
MTRNKCSSCIYAQFKTEVFSMADGLDHDSWIECDPPMGECPLDQPDDQIDQPDDQNIIPD